MAVGDSSVLPRFRLLIWGHPSMSSLASSIERTHEDELQGESNSISNQKRILEAYAKQNGFTNLRWYTDDGYSGANFAEVR